MKYYFIPYHVVHEQIQSMVEENKADFAKHYGEIKPDYEYFDHISRMGMGYIALAVSDGEIAGFAGFVVEENATHEELTAENVVLYFRKEHRGQNFRELLDFSKGQLAFLGVKKMTVTIKSDEVFARSLRLNGFDKSYEIWEVNCG